jgi:diguanylate cyclase (GGDEF)-like protein/PAS domain S-box-containing protein
MSVHPSEEGQEMTTIITATILVIDDSEDDQRLYQRSFKDFDCFFNLVMASSAEAGFAYLANAVPSLILLDYNLPDMDGFSFMKKLAENSNTPIPIVMLTGESNAAVAVEVMKQGADDYLVKDTEGRYLRLLPGVVGRVLAAHAQREQTQRMHKETEALLRRNQALMQNSMDGIHMMDMGGNIVEANDAFCDMLGYTQEEMARLNVADWNCQWSAEELRERFKQLIGKSAKFETVHRRKDGTLIDVEISTSGIKIEDQYFLFASSRDITERKRAEELQHKSEERYRALFENMLDGYAYCKILFEGDTASDFIFINVNNAFEKLTGLKNVIGKKVSEAIPGIKKSNPELFEIYGRVALTGVPERFENYMDPLGIWFAVTVYSPEKEYFVAIFDNITQRKKAEVMLKKHKLVIDSANDGFWTTDSMGNLLDANEAYATMSGYSIDELIGMHISQLDAFDQPEDVAARGARIIAHGHERFESRHRHKDGHLFDIEASVAYMPEIQQFFVFCRDITERKRNEDALRVAAVAFETHEAILITDRRANIVRVNQAFTDITGYRPEEVLGQNPRILSAGRQDKAFYIDMWQQLLHTGSWAGEIWDKRKNGQIYPKWLTITAVRDERQEVTHYVSIFSDITVRKQAEEEIHKLAFYDALTKLPNRRLFLDRFRSALAASVRRDDYGAVLFIDLDRFKALNDTLGHDYGDLLLIEVGVRIKSCVREMDTVARFGGDEFVVLIEALSDDKDDATFKVSLVAEKIREALARTYGLKGHEHHSSPSIGISLYHGHDESLDVLIEHADMAMYQAKESGRNAVRFFDPIMQNNVAAHDALDNDLHYAIELQQLHLHYQIQVDNDNHPLGAEAFLRWIHPERGMIMPGQFIQIAEESDLIIDIGHWVLQTACHQLALWGKNEKTHDLTLTVNISAKQFAKPDFVGEVADILKEQQAEPTHLKLELSERLVMADMNGAMDKIHALRSLGVRLSMDNFGTMYSSLSFLKQLSSDQLKIHQEFVQGIMLEGNDAQLVQAVIDLAKSLDLDVFAEGVETEDQRAFLKSHDCNSYQGYLFGKPVSIDEFEEAIKRF